MSKKPWPPWTTQSEVVLKQVAYWSRTYESGVPQNPRKLNHPFLGEDGVTTIVTRYKHRIGLTYNQLKWLSQVLDLEDFNTTQATLFRRALANHENKIPSVPANTMYYQEYDLTYDEIKYIELLLASIKLGKETPGEKLEVTKSIEKADW